LIVSVSDYFASNNNVSPQLTLSFWRKEHIAGIDFGALPCPPVFEQSDICHLDPDLTLWDIWPVQLDNGDLAEILAGTLWVMLSAPRGPDPDSRHDHARMRLLLKSGETWHDCGNLLPDGFSPGSREWSGSTRLNPETNEVTLWFTAAGRRGETKADFEQRLFHARGMLDLTGKIPRVTDWRNLTQTVVNSGEFYADLLTTQGKNGQIKGFRDPYWFRDPADGTGYLLFTGSRPPENSKSNYDGVIGLAKAQDVEGHRRFVLQPPILDAYGLASELERPHMFVKDGLYYLFWSTQGHIFDPTVAIGPTGLYGMVGPSMFGPFEPLNKTSLVLANPLEESRQAYAWQVVPNLDIVSFIDLWGLKGGDPKKDPSLKERQFGGSIAPVTKIKLDGAISEITKG
jgi:levansucrase